VREPAIAVVTNVPRKVKRLPANGANVPRLYLRALSLDAICHRRSANRCELRFGQCKQLACRDSLVALDIDRQFNGLLVEHFDLALPVYVAITDNARIPKS
jgi:hypothetical protein